MAEQDATTPVTIKLDIDPTALKQQMEAIMSDVTTKAAERLIAAANELNPEWLAQRDKAVGDAAVAAYKQANGIN
jgi:hypothetical protein